MVYIELHNSTGGEILGVVLLLLNHWVGTFAMLLLAKLLCMFFFFSFSFSFQCLISVTLRLHVLAGLLSVSTTNVLQNFVG